MPEVTRKAIGFRAFIVSRFSLWSWIVSLALDAWLEMNRSRKSSGDAVG
jgi:hypothetical protein